MALWVICRNWPRRSEIDITGKGTDRIWVARRCSGTYLGVIKRRDSHRTARLRHRTPHGLVRAVGFTGVHPPIPFAIRHPVVPRLVEVPIRGEIGVKHLSRTHHRVVEHVPEVSGEGQPVRADFSERIDELPRLGGVRAATDEERVATGGTERLLDVRTGEHRRPRRRPERFQVGRVALQ